jgi:hypothetical protein
MTGYRITYSIVLMKYKILPVTGFGPTIMKGSNMALAGTDAKAEISDGSLTLYF